jgi:hypothetical protein
MARAMSRPSSNMGVSPNESARPHRRIIAAGDMELWPVGPRVGDVKNNDATLILPVDEDEIGELL